MSKLRLTMIATVAVLVVSFTGADIHPAAALVPTTPAGCSPSTTTFSNNTPVAIPSGPAVVTSTILVAGAGPYLWDLDAQTFITHTEPADLDITVQSPAGTVVTLSTDNGGTNDDVFNGTVWDDDANPAGQVPYLTNNGLVTDHAYANLSLASPLVPEEALGAFIGENPNGTWTLTVSDDFADDSGSIDSWSLGVTTLPAAPITTTSAFSNTTPVAIPAGPTVVTSTINVAGAGTSLTDVDLTTFIPHTFASDIDYTVQSPAGTVVTLSTDNGSNNDDVFDGTVWDDDANPAGQVPYATNNGLVTDHAYGNLSLASPLVPEEALGAFIGENPNGTWTLTVSDDLAVDFGSIDSWTVDLDTGTCDMPVLTCTGTACTATFGYVAPNGGAEEFVVPADVCEVTITALGAQGGVGAVGGAGGEGGSAVATIPVQPGETLQVNVGGQGAPGLDSGRPRPGGPGGFGGGGDGGDGSTGGSIQSTGNGGGGGGGASDVRQGGTDLSNRVVVAGGGGGGGGDGVSATQAGGDGGGGGVDGATGDDGTPLSTNPAGGGGTGGSSTGGSGGSSNAESGGPGGPGGGGGGGDGDGGGGGGGGGYFGGGGGGGGDGSSAGGGGGGGSGLVPAGGVLTDGGRTGDGQVAITYDPAAGTCAPPIGPPPPPPPPAEICNKATVTVDLARGQSPTNGPDVIRGTTGADIINALGGDDIICSLGGDDIVSGNQGHDRVFGGGGDDEMRGNAGDDILRGRAGDDLLYGQAGNDTLDGGADADTCRGGTGVDTATACETTVGVP